MANYKEKLKIFKKKKTRQKEIKDNFFDVELIPLTECELKKFFDVQLIPLTECELRKNFQVIMTKF